MWLESLLSPLLDLLCVSVFEGKDVSVSEVLILWRSEGYVGSSPVVVLQLSP